MFNISADEGTAVACPAGEKGENGRLPMITMKFDALVSNFNIRTVNGKSDGVALGGARLAPGQTPAAVPVPAAGLLLLTTLGGLAALARRRKR